MLPGLHLLPARLIRRIIRPYRAIEGFLTEAEAVALYRAANRLSPGATVVEIGSWKGKSTYCLARGLRAGGRVHVIDPFDAYGEPGSAEIYAREKSAEPLEAQFIANLAPVKSAIVVHRGYSRKFTDDFSRIDLLMIDGDHSVEGCRFDFVNFSPLIASGGWIAFHDYYPDRSDLGPTWVIDNLVKPSGHYTEYTQANSLWLARKI